MSLKAKVVVDEMNVQEKLNLENWFLKCVQWSTTESNTCKIDPAGLDGREVDLSLKQEHKGLGLSPYLEITLNRPPSLTILCSVSGAPPLECVLGMVHDLWQR